MEFIGKKFELLPSCSSWSYDVSLNSFRQYSLSKWFQLFWMTVYRSSLLDGALILSGKDFTNSKQYSLSKWFQLSWMTVNRSSLGNGALILSGMDFTNLKQYSLSKWFQLSWMTVKRSTFPNGVFSWTMGFLKLLPQIFNWI